MEMLSLFIYINSIRINAIKWAYRDSHNEHYRAGCWAVGRYTAVIFTADPRLINCQLVVSSCYGGGGGSSPLAALSTATIQLVAAVVAVSRKWMPRWAVATSLLVAAISSVQVGFMAPLLL
ncbi:hypothetical protein FOZ61_007850 [Perkinsus olseni]|uniref:Uncharacterized protein n=1 Tax=Perkinsus olseni TaxID=32597 RepID=A0A7J6L720_PEROL|nr:hypothetical protein FOZ61_007850 [Perkinsus olseni]